MDARPDEDFLVVAQAAARVDAAVVEGRDLGRVDGRGEGEGFADEAVFEARDEVGFPAEALHLPGAEGEGREGDDCCCGGLVWAFLGVGSILQARGT